MVSEAGQADPDQVEQLELLRSQEDRQADYWSHLNMVAIKEKDRVMNKMVTKTAQRDSSKNG